MKRKVLLLLFTALLAGSVQAKADVFLLGFTGFDYEQPVLVSGPNPDDYLVFGEGYRVLGFVTSVGPLLAPYYDPITNEYTFYLFNLAVGFHSYDTGTQLLQVFFDNNGRGRYFEDARAGGTAGTYGVNPPNATAPQTFIDGRMILGGDIDQMALYYSYATNQGGFSGNMTQDEGDYLVYIPPAQRGGWILGGLLGRPNQTIPEGYVNQVSGECRIPDVVPTSHKTWGSLKALYR